MATIVFHKYQGTGNDFIMIDGRSDALPILSATIIETLCDRKMGIGADGLIIIKNHQQLDFEMVYYNADGSQSLCGNGSRCAVNFAKSLGIVKDKASFLTVDGTYHADIQHDLVHLKMKDIDAPIQKGKDYFVHNGSPHHIVFTKNNEKTDVLAEGRKIRHSREYIPEGTNVNFVELIDERTIFVRTFERGVENETLSCGTGIAASCLATALKKIKSPIQVKTLGGDLTVSFSMTSFGKFTNIVLSGPAKEVYHGSINV